VAADGVSLDGESLSGVYFFDGYWNNQPKWQRASATASSKSQKRCTKMYLYFSATSETPTWEICTGEMMGTPLYLVKSTHELGSNGKYQFPHECGKLWEVYGSKDVATIYAQESNCKVLQVQGSGNQKVRSLMKTFILDGEKNGRPQWRLQGQFMNEKRVFLYFNPAVLKWELGVPDREKVFLYSDSNSLSSTLARCDSLLHPKFCNTWFMSKTTFLGMTRDAPVDLTFLPPVAVASAVAAGRTPGRTPRRTPRRLSVRRSASGRLGRTPTSAARQNTPTTPQFRTPKRTPQRLNSATKATTTVSSPVTFEPRSAPRSAFTAQLDAVAETEPTATETTPGKKTLASRKYLTACAEVSPGSITPAPARSVRFRSLVAAKRLSMSANFGSRHMSFLPDNRRGTAGAAAATTHGSPSPAPTRRATSFHAMRKLHRLHKSCSPGKFAKLCASNGPQTRRDDLDRLSLIDALQSTNKQMIEKLQSATKQKSNGTEKGEEAKPPTNRQTVPRNVLQTVTNTAPTWSPAKVPDKNDELNRARKVLNATIEKLEKSRKRSSIAKSTAPSTTPEPVARGPRKVLQYSESEESDDISENQMLSSIATARVMRLAGLGKLLDRRLDVGADADELAAIPRFKRRSRRTGRVRRGTPYRPRRRRALAHVEDLDVGLTQTGNSDIDDEEAFEREVLAGGCGCFPLFTRRQRNR